MIEGVERMAQLLTRFAQLVLFGTAPSPVSRVTPENPLSRNDVANMKLAVVATSFAPKAYVERDGARDVLAAKIEAYVAQALEARLAGDQPVRLEIVIKRFSIPSAMSNFLTGRDPELLASATLIDARTGALIIPDAEVRACVPGGHAVAEMLEHVAVGHSADRTVESKLVTELARLYREWLTNGA